MAEEKDFLEVIREAGGNARFYNDLAEAIITGKKADLSDGPSVQDDTKVIGKLNAYEHALDHIADNYKNACNEVLLESGPSSYTERMRMMAQAANCLYKASLL